MLRAGRLAAADQLRRAGHSVRRAPVERAHAAAQAGCLHGGPAAPVDARRRSHPQRSACSAAARGAARGAAAAIRASGGRRTSRRRILQCCRACAVPPASLKPGAYLQSRPCIRSLPVRSQRVLLFQCLHARLSTLRHAPVKPPPLCKPYLEGREAAALAAFNSCNKSVSLSWRAEL